ncbi:MAG TPA: hypothetical protein VGD67_23600 [Pseudonocardiaceae bacterium]
MSGWLWLVVLIGGLLLVSGIVDWRRRYSVRGSEEPDRGHGGYGGPSHGGSSCGGGCGSGGP